MSTVAASGARYLVGRQVGPLGLKPGQESRASVGRYPGFAGIGAAVTFLLATTVIG